jgi:hypothetical protein
MGMFTKRQMAGYKAAATKGWAGRSQAAKAAAFTRKYGKIGGNPYSKVTANSGLSADPSLDSGHFPVRPGERMEQGRTEQAAATQDAEEQTRGERWELVGDVEWGETAVRDAFKAVVDLCTTVQSVALTKILLGMDNGQDAVMLLAANLDQLPRILALQSPQSIENEMVRLIQPLACGRDEKTDVALGGNPASDMAVVKNDPDVATRLDFRLGSKAPFSVIGKRHLQQLVVHRVAAAMPHEPAEDARAEQRQIAHRIEMVDAVEAEQQARAQTCEAEERAGVLRTRLDEARAVAATDREARERAEVMAKAERDRADALRTRLDEAQAAVAAEREQKQAAEIRAVSLARAESERENWSRWRRLREALWRR